MLVFVGIYFQQLSKFSFLDFFFVYDELQTNFWGESLDVHQTKKKYSERFRSSVFCPLILASLVDFSPKVLYAL